MLFKDFITYENSVKFSVFDTSRSFPTMLESINLTHEKLKPCPFCGGVAEIINCEACNVYIGLAVRCKDCMCGTAAEYEREIINVSHYVNSRMYLSDVLKSVVDKWNNRITKNVQDKDEGGSIKTNGKKKKFCKSTDGQ